MVLKEKLRFWGKSNDKINGPMSSLVPKQDALNTDI